MTISAFRSISTFARNTFNQDMIARNRTALETVSKELSTGFKADVAKDLGMRSSQSYEMRSLISSNEAFVMNNKLTDNKLQIQSTVMSDIRADIQGVLDLAVPNQMHATTSAATLQLEARSALDSIISKLNTSVNGEHLFAGINTETKPMTAYDAVNPGTGFSPAGVVDGVTGGAILSAADAAAKIAELQGIFDSSNAVTPARNFEDTFYSGTDLGAGQRKSAIIDDNRKIEYGVQANDPEFTSALQGLSMLASVDVTSISDAAGYQAYMGEVINRISEGINELATSQAKLGKNRQVIEETTLRIQDENDIFTSKILALEAIDPYEAATRLSNLELQLEATYSATARLSKLSFLNYM